MLKKVLYLIVFAVLTLNAFSQDEHIKVEAFPSVGTAEAGETIFIKVEFEIDKYWYSYAMHSQLSDEGIGPNPTELIIKPETIFEKPEKIYASQTQTKFDKGFEIDVDYYKGKAQFIVPVKLKRNVDFSKDEAYAEFYIQLCDTTSCLPPAAISGKIGADAFDYESDITDGMLAYDVTYDADGYPQAALQSGTKIEKADKSDNTEQLKTESQTEIDDAKDKGIFSFLWFAMTAGALALLTPCVFPMIPITVSFFTKRAEKNKGQGLRDASTYAIGIIITFTALGFLLALLFGATGIRDFAANGWVNMFIAAIFIIFALNLFGAFEIQLPTGMMNKLNQKSQGGGIISVLLMGLTFSLTSFTCTVPFVGSALISASGGEWFYPIIGMLGFSAVFAAPFFLLALFPSAMTTLPKAGGWMNNVKVIMGFLEIAAAIKFISNADLVWAWGILPREMFLAIWVACGLFIVFYVLGKFRLAHDSPIDSVGTPRLMFSVAFASITIWLITGLFGKPLGELDAFLPPPDYETITGSAAVSGNLSNLSQKANSNDFSDWYKNYDAALKAAKEQNKVLFIDFTGFTCTNCRLMETGMFTKQDVKAKMDQMIKVKLFTDRREEPYLSNKQFQEDRFGSIELPLYVIMTPDEKLLGTKSFTRDEQEFNEFLQKGIDAMSSPVVSVN